MVQAAWRLKSAGEAVLVDDFAGEVEAGLGGGFHAAPVDFFAFDATADDEFFAEWAFAADRDVTALQAGKQGFDIAIGALGPGSIEHLEQRRSHRRLGMPLGRIGIDLLFGVVVRRCRSSARRRVRPILWAPIDGQRPCHLAVGLAPRRPTAGLENCRGAQSPVGDQHET